MLTHVIGIHKKSANELLELIDNQDHLLQAKLGELGAEVSRGIERPKRTMGRGGREDEDENSQH